MSEKEQRGSIADPTFDAFDITEHGRWEHDKLSGDEDSKSKFESSKMVFLVQNSSLNVRRTIQSKQSTVIHHTASTPIPTLSLHSIQHTPEERKSSSSVIRTRKTKKVRLANKLDQEDR